MYVFIFIDVYMYLCMQHMCISLYMCAYVDMYVCTYIIFMCIQIFDTGWYMYNQVYIRKYL